MAEIQRDPFILLLKEKDPTALFLLFLLRGELIVCGVISIALVEAKKVEESVFFFSERLIWNWMLRKRFFFHCREHKCL